MNHAKHSAHKPGRRAKAATYSVYFDIADRWERSRTYKTYRGAVRHAVSLLQDDERCGTIAGIALHKGRGRAWYPQGEATEGRFLVVAEPLVNERGQEPEPCGGCLHTFEDHNSDFEAGDTSLSCDVCGCRGWKEIPQLSELKAAA